jgi:hypothetical protein
MNDNGKDPGFPPPYEDYPPTIPTFGSVEEERDFWDTHEITPYLSQFEDVTDSPPPDLKTRSTGPDAERSRRSGRERMELLSLRFPAEMIDGVRTIADQRHLPYQTLLRSWVGERLAQEIAAGEHTTEKKAS